MIHHDTIISNCYYFYTTYTLPYNDRETHNPQSPPCWALPTLFSGAQINGMTLTGAADPAAGFSGMVQIVIFCGHCSIFSDPYGDGKPVGRQEYLALRDALCHRAVTVTTVTVTSKEQWISSFASFSRWRPRDIMHFGTSAGDWACDRVTHAVPCKFPWVKWLAVRQKTAFCLKAGDTLISDFLLEWWSTIELRDISPTDVHAASLTSLTFCAAGWT